MYFPNGKEVFRLYFGCFVSIMLPIRDIAIAKQLGGLCLTLVWGSFLIRSPHYKALQNTIGNRGLGL